MLLQQLDGRAETKFDHDDRRLLSLAMANLQRLQALMRDILAYSQLGGARNTVITPLRQPLEMALANLQKDLEETGAGVDFDALPTLPVDPAQLTLVFQNLIGNALKFRSREPPRLRIQATLENREHVVSIADNGQGFDPQYAERIFLPFKRLHGPEIPGSGIGLATCKRIVEQLGGRIWAVGERGKGSTFYFTMPAGA
jgi:chemotaxis family two-component system sensor kinase Cph1